MNENNIFIKTIEQKYEKFSNYYTIMSSDFLSVEQQSALSGFMRSRAKEGVYFYGGYGEAERRMVIFLPDYTEAAEKISSLPKTLEEREKSEKISRILTEYFEGNEALCPLSVLEISIPTAEHKVLSHRDYLGALMGEGIKREKVGDILVSEKGAKIIVVSELCDYLAQNFSQVGAVSVRAKKAPISSLKTVEIKTTCLKFTVSSPRIDNILVGIFGISRKDAQTYISRGKVFVSGMEISKPDMTLRGGEKIVLRGMGKAIYQGVSGSSKKGKLYITAEKYI